MKGKEKKRKENNKVKIDEGKNAWKQELLSCVFHFFSSQ
jgi:hypothetical protein